MASWREFASAEPTLAEAFERRFDKYRHKVLATIRKDGSPRISGVEAEFRDGDLWLGMMGGSKKALDLQRDARVALHSGTEDPPDPAAPGTVFDAKVSGRAFEVVGSKRSTPEDAPGHQFRMDFDEVVLVILGDPPDHLVLNVWTERGGLRRIQRY